MPVWGVLAASGGLGAAACTPDPVIEIEYAPYEGEAYPDRIPPIAWPAGRTAVVTDSYGDSLTLIDVATGEAFDTRPIGRNPVDLDGPHHLAADPAHGRLFVALSYPKIGGGGPHAAHGSSVSNGYVQLIDEKTLVPKAAMRVDPNPGDIVLSDDASRLIVTHFDLQRAVKNPTDLDKARSTIAVIDPDSIGVSGATPTFIPICVAPHGALLDGPSGDRAFVACYGEDSIAIVDTTDPTAEVIRVPVAADVSGFGDPKYGPYALVRSPDDSLLAVSNTVSKDVRFFDVASREMDPLPKISLQGAPYFAVFVDVDTLVIPTQQPDQLVMVDLTGTNETVIHPMVADECKLPHQVVHDDDGTFWLVCEGDHTVPGTIVHLSALFDTLGVATVGVYPDSFTFLPPVLP